MRLLGVILTGLAVAGAWVAVPAYANESGEDASMIERMGAYVLVEDVEASSEFYGRLFSTEPEFASTVFVSFNIADGQFALASKAAFSPDAKVGDNAVPNLRVNDIDAMFAHARSVAPRNVLSETVNDEGPLALSKMRDPDGNMIEFYSVKSASTNSSSD